MTRRPRLAWCCAASSLACCKRYKKPNMIRSAMRAGAARRWGPAARGQRRAGKILRGHRRAGSQDIEVPRLAGAGAGEKIGEALRKGFQEKELGYLDGSIRQLANVRLRTEPHHSPTFV